MDRAWIKTQWPRERWGVSECVCARAHSSPPLSPCSHGRWRAACGDLWQRPGPGRWASCHDLRPPDCYRLEEKERRWGRMERQKKEVEKRSLKTTQMSGCFLFFFCFCFLITVTHRRGFHLQHSMCKKNQHVFTSNSNHEAEATWCGAPDVQK